MTANRRPHSRPAPPAATGPVQPAARSRLQKICPSNARTTSSSKVRWTSKPQWKTIGTSSTRPARAGQEHPQQGPHVVLDAGRGRGPEPLGRRPGRGRTRSRSRGVRNDAPRRRRSTPFARSRRASGTGPGPSHAPAPTCPRARDRARAGCGPARGSRPSAPTIRIRIAPRWAGTGQLKVRLPRRNRTRGSFTDARGRRRRRLHRCVHRVAVPRTARRRRRRSSSRQPCPGGMLRTLQTADGVPYEYGPRVVSVFRGTPDALTFVRELRRSPAADHLPGHPTAAGVPRDPVPGGPRQPAAAPVRRPDPEGVRGDPGVGRAARRARPARLPRVDRGADADRAGVRRVQREVLGSPSRGHARDVGQAPTPRAGGRDGASTGSRAPRRTTTRPAASTRSSTALLEGVDVRYGVTAERIERNGSTSTVFTDAGEFRRRPRRRDRHRSTRCSATGSAPLEWRGYRIETEVVARDRPRRWVRARRGAVLVGVHALGGDARRPHDRLRRDPPRPRARRPRRHRRSSCGRSSTTPCACTPCGGRTSASTSTCAARRPAPGIVPLGRLGPLQVRDDRHHLRHGPAHGRPARALPRRRRRRPVRGHARRARRLGQLSAKGAPPALAEVAALR